MNDDIYFRNKWYRDAMNAIRKGVDAEDIILVMAETLEEFEKKMDEWIGRSQK